MMFLKRIASLLSSILGPSAQSLLPLDQVVQTTRDNYQGRHEKFAAWAEQEDNSKPAQECRKMLLEALESTSCFCSANDEKAVQKDDTPMTIRILDAGCGSGRDVEAFLRCNVVNGRGVIQAYGFDVCPGFVATCQQKGLSRVVQADFFSYFERLHVHQAEGRENDADHSNEFSGEEDARHYKVNNDKKKNNDTEDSSSSSPLKFHAIFSLAALFHVPRNELKRILELFSDYMVDEGYLLISLPNGNRNGMGKDGRWMNYMPKRQQIALLEDCGFQVLTTRKISQYGGDDWVVTLSKKKKKRKVEHELHDAVSTEKPAT